MCENLEASFLLQLAWFLFLNTRSVDARGNLHPSFININMARKYMSRATDPRKGAIVLFSDNVQCLNKHTDFTTSLIIIVVVIHVLQIPWEWYRLYCPEFHCYMFIKYVFSFYYHSNITIFMWYLEIFSWNLETEIQEKGIWINTSVLVFIANLWGR